MSYPQFVVGGRKGGLLYPQFVVGGRKGGLLFLQFVVGGRDGGLRPCYDTLSLCGYFWVV